MILLDGKKTAQVIQEETRIAAEAFTREHGFRPGLAVVRVGEDPASRIYVENKCKACQKVGLESWHHHLPADTPREELIAIVERLNADVAVHGILVQLPLPRAENEAIVIPKIAPLKDVDGLTPESLGLLAGGNPRFLPCTPHGVLQLLLYNGLSPEGKHVVIVGRSNIVGKPLALLLLRKAAGCNATVTICHSGTNRQELAELTRSADIVVMAIGKARFLKADMIRPGAIVVDVGINRMPDGKLAGDVDFETVREVASAITPVPGGVGPMTITMLLRNTVQAARLQVGEISLWPR